MPTKSPEISPIEPHDCDAVEAMSAQAFGPGRFARSAFRLREGVPHEPDLSFIARIANKLAGSVQLTQIKIGDEVGLLLGPLVVAPAHKNTGIGARLMERAVQAARKKDFGCILLVGDLPYYQRFGFEGIERGRIIFPGPVDPERLLVCPLKPGAGDKLNGKVERFLEPFPF